jgi:hypothetical protein
MVMVMNTNRVVVGHGNRSSMSMGMQSVVVVMSLVISLRVVMIVTHPFAVGMSNISFVVVV